MRKNPKAKSDRRTRVFRASAIALGLAIPILVEMFCRLFGWGAAPVYEDPYVGFKGVNPLFRLNEAGTHYEVAKAKLKFFSPESFPAKKISGTHRVFCLGGSTVKGRPYAKETAFSTWLELGLQAAEPESRWEVINCGGISYASYRLVNLLRECISYQPDLIVICTGHNEFLEDRSYEHLKQIPNALAVTQTYASRLNVYRLASRWFRKPPPPDSEEKFNMPEEVEALLDYRGGLETYDRNEAWRESVVAHFEHNLHAMIALASHQDVPVIVIRPPNNLRNSPPFKSLHREDLSLDERLEWQTFINRARDAYESNLDASVSNLLAAINIDSRYAETHYELGKCYELQGQRIAAKRSFERALDEDICPLRMVRPLQEAMRLVANQHEIPLIDAHALLEADSRLQILGNDQLVDHIHPSIDGHKRIADAIIKVMVASGTLKRRTGWKERQTENFKAHFDTLEPAYFAAARRALHGLEEWAAGRAQGPPVETLASPVK